jgi:hypothetical protein
VPSTYSRRLVQIDLYDRNRPIAALSSSQAGTSKPRRETNLIQKSILPSYRMSPARSLKSDLFPHIKEFFPHQNDLPSRQSDFFPHIKQVFDRVLATATNVQKRQISAQVKSKVNELWQPDRIPSPHRHPAKSFVPVENDFFPHQYLSANA